MGQLVASSVATGNGVVICLCGLDQGWGPWEVHGGEDVGPRPFPLAEGMARCPSPGPVSALGWGTPTCAVLASINHHGLRALPFLGLWEGRGGQAVKSEELGQATWNPFQGCSGLTVGARALKAEPHLQLGKDVGGQCGATLHFADRKTEASLGRTCSNLEA